MLNQITQLRLPDGQVVALADWTDKPLYGSCDLGSGFTNEIIDLFQVSVGRPVPSAAATAGGTITPRQNTLADTNISTQGGLSSTEEFLVYAIKPDVQEFVFEPNNFTTRASVGTVDGVGANMFSPQPRLTTLAQLGSQLLIELEISQKIYSQAAMSWFNSGFGPMAGVSVTSAEANGGTPATAGLPSQEAVRTLVIPQHIGGQEKFRLRLRNPSNAAVNFGATEATPPALTGADHRMVTARIYLDGLYKRPLS